MIHTDFDPEKTAVIEPSEFYHPMENMPEALIGVFSRPLTEKYAAEFHGEVIMQYQDCNGGEPVYRCTSPNGTVFALMCMRVGAPSACGIMEEMIPHGVKKFLMLGSCGALDHAITAGHILVPYAAMRDEGTSYHYAPPAEEAVLEPACVDAVCQALEDMDVPYARVKTWTTDAFFRETRGKVEKRLKQGCSVVEMECAAMATVAAFRNVKFAQFMWAADSLSGEKWDARNLNKLGTDAGEIYMEAAIRTLEYL